MRSLLRTRKQFVREQTRHVQRIQKTLEEGNIKLDAVISDILGVNGRRMIEGMIAGESNPQKLAALADRRLKASPTELRDALHGRLTQTHRFLLRTHLKQWDALDATPAPRLRRDKLRRGKLRRGRLMPRSTGRSMW